MGVEAFLLDAGGQLLAGGAPPGEGGWPAAIADPGDRSRPACALLLRDVSAATSGNAERPGEILDPATGVPVSFRGSATALAPDATSADALSTALFVMGPERGLAWSRAHADLAAVYLEPGSRSDGPAPLRISRPAIESGRGPLWVSARELPDGRLVDVRLP
jgi:thiamine biosynthesis lipoprotein